MYPKFLILLTNFKGQLSMNVGDKKIQICQFGFLLYLFQIFFKLKLKKIIINYKLFFYILLVLFTFYYISKHIYIFSLQQICQIFALFVSRKFFHFFFSLFFAAALFCSIFNSIVKKINKTLLFKI